LSGAAPAYQHVAALYEGEDGFVERTLPFVRDAIAAEEPVLVMTGRAKGRRLAAELNGGADAVEFRDMTDEGRNPACILPIWRDFADRHAGRPVRGVGEPVWPARSPAELGECERHEALLNVAFDDEPPLRLMCPYDTATLRHDAIEGALRTHPYLLEGDCAVDNLEYLAPGLAPSTLEGALAPAPPSAAVVSISSAELRDLRAFVAERAAAAGLEANRCSDLALAAHELVTNTIRHAAGVGTLSTWSDPASVFCEVRDGGHIAEPLVGRSLPRPDDHRGRGLWIVNHLCDLVQIRSLPTGNVVRLRMDLDL